MGTILSSGAQLNDVDVPADGRLASTDTTIVTASRPIEDRVSSGADDDFSLTDAANTLFFDAVAVDQLVRARRPPSPDPERYEREYRQLEAVTRLPGIVELLNAAAAGQLDALVIGRYPPGDERRGRVVFTPDADGDKALTVGSDLLSAGFIDLVLPLAAGLHLAIDHPRRRRIAAAFARDVRRLSSTADATEIVAARLQQLWEDDGRSVAAIARAAQQSASAVEWSVERESRGTPLAADNALAARRYAKQDRISWMRQSDELADLSSWYADVFGREVDLLELGSEAFDPAAAERSLTFFTEVHRIGIARRPGNLDYRQWLACKAIAEAARARAASPSPELHLDLEELRLRASDLHDLKDVEVATPVKVIDTRAPGDPIWIGQVRRRKGLDGGTDPRNAPGPSPDVDRHEPRDHPNAQGGREPGD